MTVAPTAAGRARALTTATLDTNSRLFPALLNVSMEVDAAAPTAALTVTPAGDASSTGASENVAVRSTVRSKTGNAAERGLKGLRIWEHNASREAGMHGHGHTARTAASSDRSAKTAGAPNGDSAAANPNTAVLAVGEPSSSTLSLRDTSGGGGRCAVVTGRLRTRALARTATRRTSTCARASREKTGASHSHQTRRRPAGSTAPPETRC